MGSSTTYMEVELSQITSHVRNEICIFWKRGDGADLEAFFD